MVCPACVKPERSEARRDALAEAARSRLGGAEVSAGLWLSDLSVKEVVSDEEKIETVRESVERGRKLSELTDAWRDIAEVASPEAAAAAIEAAAGNPIAAAAALAAVAGEDPWEVLERAARECARWLVRRARDEEQREDARRRPYCGAEVGFDFLKRGEE